MFFQKEELVLVLQVPTTIIIPKKTGQIRSPQRIDYVSWRPLVGQNINWRTPVSFAIQNASFKQTKKTLPVSFVIQKVSFKNNKIIKSNCARHDLPSSAYADLFPVINSIYEQNVNQYSR